MKTLLTICLITAAAILPVSSQTPAGKSPLQALKEIRANNVKLLEQQAKTIQRLDALDKAAQELKMLGKRS